MEVQFIQFLAPNSATVKSKNCFSVHVNVCLYIHVIITLMRRLKYFHLPNVTAANELFAHYVEAWESWQVEAANELHKQHEH